MFSEKAYLLRGPNNAYAYEAIARHLRPSRNFLRASARGDGPGVLTQEVAATSILLEEAGLALYRSRNVGHNRVSHFDVSDLSRLHFAQFATVRPETQAA